MLTTQALQFNMVYLGDFKNDVKAHGIQPHF